MICLAWDHDSCDHSGSHRLSAEKPICQKPVSNLLMTCSKIRHRLFSQVSQPGLIFVSWCAHFWQRLRSPLVCVVLHCYYYYVIQSAVYPPKKNWRENIWCGWSTVFIGYNKVWSVQFAADLAWFIQHRRCIGPHADAKSVCLELMFQPLPRLTPFFECPCSLYLSSLSLVCQVFSWILELPAVVLAATWIIPFLLWICWFMWYNLI